MSSNKSQKSLLFNSLISRKLDEPHRTATALELFYDLIYVVAIASLATEFHHAVSAWHHAGRALSMYILMFFCIWWPWNSYTLVFFWLRYRRCVIQVVFFCTDGRRHHYCGRH